MNYNQYQQYQMGMGRNNNANMNGTFYNPQPQQKKRILTNPISQEKQKELMNKSTQFSLSVTEPEMNSAICSHKDTTKQNLAIRPLGDGRVQCLICGAIMNPDIVNVEYAKDIFQQAENIMQCAKLMDMNLDPEVMKQFYAQIAFYRKVPGMLDLAIKSYEKYYADYYGTSGVNNNNDNPMGNTMNILNSVFGFGFGNPAPYPYQGQPQMNNYNYQPNMMPNPNMGYNTQYMNMQNMGNQMMNGAVPTGNMNPFYADPNMNAQQQTQMPNPNVAMQTGNSIGAVDIPAPRTSQAAKNMVNEPAPAPAPDVVTKTANYTI